MTITRAVVKRVVCFSQPSLKNMTFWLALLIYFFNFSLLCVLFEIPAAAVLRLAAAAAAAKIFCYRPEYAFYLTKSSKIVFFNLSKMTQK